MKERARGKRWLRKGRYIYIRIKSATTGKWVWVSSEQEALPAALQVLREYEEGRRRQRVLAPAIQLPTLERAASDWLEERERRGLRNTRVEEGHLRIHVLPRLGQHRVDDIGESEMRTLVLGLIEKGLAPRTVRHIFGTVSSLFSSLVDETPLTSNPCSFRRSALPPVVDRDPDWRPRAIYNRAEVELLISSPLIPMHRRVVNALLALTGSRIGGVAGLRVRDLIDREGPLRHLIVAHSYRRRSKTLVVVDVPVHPTLDEILTEWIDVGYREHTGRNPRAEDLLCPSHRDAMWTDKQFYWHFSQDLEVHGLRHRRVHDLRRTFISLALADGARQDIHRRITHPSKKDQMDDYITAFWPSLCEEVSKLRIHRLPVAVAVRSLEDEDEGTPKIVDGVHVHLPEELDEDRDHGSDHGSDLRFAPEFMVPRAGLEPARSILLGILSPLRLPFRHPGLRALYRAKRWGSPVF